MSFHELNTHLFGVYVGMVVYTKDPAHLGRVQVRVLAVHGVETQVEDVALPWATLCQLGGGFYDGGSHLPPPVGSTVLVVFEQGCVDRPFVLGGVPKRPDPKDWKYGDLDTSMKEWVPKDAITDLPKEARIDREETKSVVFKTQKGAALIVEDQDEAESLKFVDRSGQVIRMESPVTVGENQGNASQRGDKSVLTGDQLPYSSMVGQTAFIQVIDLAGQYIKVKAEEGSETVEIYSRKRSPEGPDEQRVIIDNTVGGEEIRVIDRKGQRIVLKSGGSDQHILLQSGNARIRIDGASDTIYLDAARVDINKPGPAGEGT